MADEDGPLPDATKPLGGNYPLDQVPGQGKHLWPGCMPERSQGGPPGGRGRALRRAPAAAFPVGSERAVEWHAARMPSRLIVMMIIIIELKQCVCLVHTHLALTPPLGILPCSCRDVPTLTCQAPRWAPFS